MAALHLYFQVHQPYRLNEYTFFDIGNSQEYFNEVLNIEILDKVSDKCYIPANRALKDLIEVHGEDFYCTFSFSGVVLEQLQAHRPDVIESFQQLISTGHVEVLSETYYHSLASLKDLGEFKAQVQLHDALIAQLFGIKPTVFRNTELIVHQELISYCSESNYIGLVGEGTTKLIGEHTPNQVFGFTDSPLKMLCRDFELSDEIAYRFSDSNYAHYPLTAQKFTALLREMPHSDCVSLFMDYETFGEHHWEETLIFEFLRAFPDHIIKDTSCKFSKIGDTLRQAMPTAVLQQIQPSSWADTEKDLSAWLGNSMQKDALALIYELKEKIWRSGDEKYVELWRKLQTSDHFYYMSTKSSQDGEVHNYFSPYRSPYDAYLYYTNIIKDINCIFN